MPRSDDLRGVSNVIVGAGLLVVQSGFCDNNVATALDPATGAVLWRTDPSLPIDELSRPLVYRAWSPMTSSSCPHRSGWSVSTLPPVKQSGPPRLVTRGRVRIGGRGVVAGCRPDPCVGSRQGAELWTLRTNPPLPSPSPSPTPGPANPADLPPFVSAAADGEHVYIRVDSEVTAHAATGRHPTVEQISRTPGRGSRRSSPWSRRSHDRVEWWHRCPRRRQRPSALVDTKQHRRRAVGTQRVPSERRKSVPVSVDRRSQRSTWRPGNTLASAWDLPPRCAVTVEFCWLGSGSAGMYLMDAATGTDLWSNTAPQIRDFVLVQPPTRSTATVCISDGTVVAGESAHPRRHHTCNGSRRA